MRPHQLFVILSVAPGKDLRIILKVVQFICEDL